MKGTLYARNRETGRLSRPITMTTADAYIRLEGFYEPSTFQDSDLTLFLEPNADLMVIRDHLSLMYAFVQQLHRRGARYLILPEKMAGYLRPNPGDCWGQIAKAGREYGFSGPIFEPYPRLGGLTLEICLHAFNRVAEHKDLLAKVRQFPKDRIPEIPWRLLSKWEHRLLKILPENFIQENNGQDRLASLLVLADSVELKRQGIMPVMLMIEARNQFPGRHHLMVATHRESMGDLEEIVYRFVEDMEMLFLLYELNGF